MINLSLSYDEKYEIIKLYDILRDMDFELTDKQSAVFDKIQEAGYNSVSYTHLTLPTIYSV